MNPHQVDAALFAFASPLSKGALLADEVGLGKTIEAGLVISQRWAEGKRRILIIAPSNLRKQWHQEMNEKFFIPCTIIESKPYNAEVKAGNFRPFDRTDSIVICSYQFARNKAADVHATCATTSANGYSGSSIITTAPCDLPARMRRIPPSHGGC